MRKLEEIIEKIVALKDISSDSSTGLREYRLEQGTAFTATVYQSEDIALAIGFFSEGTIFPYHRHDKSKEVLVVYKGDMTVITDTRKVSLNVGESVELEPGEGHMLKIKKDSKLLVITIPPDFDAVARIGENGR